MPVLPYQFIVTCCFATMDTYELISHFVYYIVELITTVLPIVLPNHTYENY